MTESMLTLAQRNPFAWTEPSSLVAIPSEVLRALVLWPSDTGVLSVPTPEEVAKALTAAGALVVEQVVEALPPGVRYAAANLLFRRKTDWADDIAAAVFARDTAIADRNRVEERLQAVFNERNEAQANVEALQGRQIHAALGVRPGETLLNAARRVAEEAGGAMATAWEVVGQELGAKEGEAPLSAVLRLMRERADYLSRAVYAEGRVLALEAGSRTGDVERVWDSVRAELHAGREIEPPQLLERIDKLVLDRQALMKSVNELVAERDGLKAELRQMSCAVPQFSELILDITGGNPQLETASVAVRRVVAERDTLLALVERWKEASGLVCGGDPDGMTPEAAKRYWEAAEKTHEETQARCWSLNEEADRLSAENLDLRLGILPAPPARLEELVGEGAPLPRVPVDRKGLEVIVDAETRLRAESTRAVIAGVETLMLRLRSLLGGGTAPGPGEGNPTSKPFERLTPSEREALNRAIPKHGEL